ncbi:MAG: T9SS type A sorting domain-containing protein [Bacteroidia bacterium]|nr:T9SS type A sorting domain-containing protein [Bacteroidia bacterium]
MKKLLLILSLAVCVNFTATSTHLMGGQITANQLNGLDYEIVLTLYRDTVGIPIAPTASMNIVDTSTGAAQILNIDHGGAQGFINGVEVYTYADTFSFPNAGIFLIDWSECCRNMAILNMSNPGSESLYLKTLVTVGGANSTPVFLNPPVTLAQKNAPYYYNPLPFDVDGDSLAWSLDIPLNLGAIPVVGYTLPQGAASGPYTLNNLTGEISWMPDSNGHWVSSFLVEEFRNGIKIGEIRRDMQIIVVDDTTNYSPMVINTSSWPQDALGNFSIALQPNVPFYMSILATQGDNDLMDLDVYGEPMILTSNPAQFAVTSNMPGSITGGLSWTPSQAQARTAPYIMTVRATEFHNNYVFTHDRTIMLRVGAATGIDKTDAVFSASQLFPNPASQEVFLSFNLKASSTVSVEIYDVSGKLVQSSVENVFAAGTHLINQNIASLASGNYMLRILVDKQQADILPIVVRN